MDYTFNQYNSYASEGLARAIRQNLQGEKEKPVVICIGSDLVIGDSLAPLVGTMAKEKGLSVFLYGTLHSTVTAKEVPYLRRYLETMNPKGKRIVIDAAVGERSELGFIKCRQKPTFPGRGVQKNLGSIGDLSILGIVTERSIFSQTISDLVRLKLVYAMAQTISHALCLALN
ncbi:MAG: spore protease YyaC [Clostridia bacterium]|nr:spore protease YyaC [Clostridia bacterium]